MTAVSNILCVNNGNHKWVPLKHGEEKGESTIIWCVNCGVVGMVPPKKYRASCEIPDPELSKTLVPKIYHLKE